MTITAERPVTFPDMGELEVLNRDAVGALIGVSGPTITRYVNASRPGGRYEANPFPAAAGRFGGAPYWNPEQIPAIQEWAAARPGPGAGGGYPAHKTRGE